MKKGSLVKILKLGNIPLTHRNAQCQNDTRRVTMFFQCNNDTRRVREFLQCFDDTQRIKLFFSATINHTRRLLSEEPDCKKNDWCHACTHTATTAHGNLTSMCVCHKVLCVLEQGMHESLLKYTRCLLRALGRAKAGPAYGLFGCPARVPGA